MQYEKSFRRLVVWQRGKELTIFVYKITKDFPPEEKFAMVSQMRRSAYSVVANIAEGNAKSTPKDRVHFINIAEGSLTELDCFAEIASELGYLIRPDYERILELINKCFYLLKKFKESQNFTLNSPQKNSQTSQKSQESQKSQ